MSLADAFVGCFGITLGILLIIDSPQDYYKLAGNIPLFSSMFVSVGSLALLTADRLVALKRPHFYGTEYYKCLNLRLIVLTWVIPLLINIQQTVIYLETGWKKELQVRGMIFGAFFGIGATTLAVSNILLYFAVRKYLKEREAMLPKKEVSEADFRNDERTVLNRSNILGTECEESFAMSMVIDPDTSESRMQHSADRKYNRTIKKNQELKQITFLCIVVVSTFVVLWTPLAVYRLYHAAGRSMESKWRKRLGLCFAVTNSLLNPGIYFMFRKRFRECFFQLFTC
eukprot:Seg1926.4 transcript_id=Seg1926.4/GoldUCD/mRNA.D3Y31 product="Kappa-type opioid receptor" protein_id=Seg1926.4/GoldUCD/D3Y31